MHKVATPFLSRFTLCRNYIYYRKHAFYSTSAHQQVENFLETEGPIIDVRSPKEFLEGHIPNAVNVPLFSDEERHIIGKTYKENGKERAIELGLKYVGPKLYDFVRKAKELQRNNSGNINIYCARGGMRSNSIQWLYKTACISSQILPGGYKEFRKWVLYCFMLKKNIVVLGGMTGSGKSKILQELAKQNEQIIDLELLANHKGSAYGSINMNPQPTQEELENKIAIEWAKLDNDRVVWVEDESSSIGSLHIPIAILRQMRSPTTPIIYLKRPNNERIQNLFEEYGSASIACLVEGTKKLERRLGGENTKEIISLIEKGLKREAISRILPYYDKTYQFAMKHHQGQPHREVYAENLSHADWAKKLIEEQKLFKQELQVHV